MKHRFVAKRYWKDQSKMCIRDSTKTFSATEEKEISSLAVTMQPSKTTYTHGDSFDAADMEVKATYDDGTVDENFTGYTVQYDKGNYLRYNNNKVTLIAGNKSTEVTGLAVSQKALTIEGLTAVSREYDGTTNVTLSGGKLVGVITPLNTVSLSFFNK